MYNSFHRRRGGRRLEPILYADVLLAIDFSMDFLSLYAAGRLFCLRMRFFRLALAAGCGALYGLCAVLLNLSGLGGVCLNLAVCAAMTAVAYGRCGGARRFGRAFFGVWGCGAFLAGMISLVSGGLQTGRGAGGILDFLLAAGAAVIGVTRLLRRRVSRASIRVRIPYGERCFEGDALPDSGNLLTDPLSGLPVVLLSAPTARGIGWQSHELPADGTTPRGVRAVPIRTSAGTRIVYGFFCPSLTILGGPHPRQASAVVCVDETVSDFGGCGALLPSALW